MRYILSTHRLVLFLVTLTVTGLFQVTNGFGMGAGPLQAASPAPSAVPLAVPTPVRNVVLTTVSTKPFPVPGQGPVDLTTQLGQLLVTAATESSALSPVSLSSPDPTQTCDSHIELRAAVTSIEMALTDFGITLGYSPTQTFNSIVTGAQGSVNVQVGSIGMDLSLWNCSSGECAAVAASHADQTTTSTTLSFQVDFGTITTSEQLVYNTPLGGVLAKILQSGVNGLTTSSQLNQLPWFASVQQYDPSSGTLIFSAGSQSKIGVNQSFTVLAGNGQSGACGVYQPIANIHTTAVTAVSSVAIVDQSLSANVPQVGDVVMVNTVQ